MRELLYEGKAKKIFETSTPYQVVMEFKNDVTAGNNQKRDNIDGKGSANCYITSKLFEILEENRVKTHFIKKLSITGILILFLILYYPRLHCLIKRPFQIL